MRLILALVTAVLLTLSLAAPAGAQWATTDWEVLCSLGASSQVECRNGARFPYADAAAFHEGQLKAASQWLEGLGFAEPYVTERSNGAFVAEVTDGGAATRGSGTIAAFYITRGITGGRSGRIDFVASKLTYPARLFRDSSATERSVAIGYLGTSVHELFHAVQAGETTPDVYGRLGADGSGGRERDWIFEGTAEAVMAAWLDRNPPVPGQDAYVGERHYDSPLDDPDASYETWHFWRSIGREIGSRDDVAYLAALFAEDLEPNRGIEGVHRALRPYHSDGLYHFYPQFIARYVNEERLYEHPRPADLMSYGTFTLEGGVEPLSTEAFLVHVEAPGAGIAGLSIELDEPHRSDPDLHLIVGQERYDGWDDSGERNALRTAIDPSQGPQTFLVRVANVAPEPAGTLAKAYRLRVSLQPSEPCSADAMMSVVREHYWQSQDAFNATFEEAQRAFAPLLPGGEPFVIGFLRPAEAYLADFEPVPGLHPAVGSFSITGLVEDGGIACTEPLGTNGMRAIIAEAQNDPAGFEEHAEEAAQNLAERIRRMSPEDLAAMRERSMEALRRMFSPAQGGESALSMGQEELEESLGVAGDRPVLIRLFSPNAFAWQSDVLIGGRAIEHGGLGGWSANAGAQVILELSDVGASELRVSEEPYRARLFTWGPDAAMPLYARWAGEDVPVPSSPSSEMAFQGTTQRLTATTMLGRVWITDLTGAEARGTFQLDGEGTLTTTETEFIYENGRVVDDRVVDQQATIGRVRFEGTFSAPASVAFDRAGRVVSRALKLQ